MSKFVKDMLLMHGGNVSNVSVIDVFVSIIYVFDKFYVINWQDEQVMNGCNAFNVSGGKR